MSKAREQGSKGEKIIIAKKSTRRPLCKVYLENVGWISRRYKNWFAGPKRNIYPNQNKD